MGLNFQSINVNAQMIVGKIRGIPPYSSKVLQKVEIKFLQHAPLPNQPENYIVSDTVWQQKFKIEKHQILNYLDEPEALWGDENRIDYSLIQNKIVSIKQSLFLVKVDNLNLYIEENKRKASFLYKNRSYDLPVTDANFDNLLEENSQNLEGILCVSLGENFHGHCYKIVATIF